MKIPQDPVVIIAGLAVLAGAVILIVGPKGLAKAAVNAVDGAIGGTVEGAGEMIGIPATNAEKCAIAKANGDHLDASLYCPAAEYAAWEAKNLAEMFGGK